MGCHQDDEEDEEEKRTVDTKRRFPEEDEEDAADMEAAARALDSVDGPSSYSMGPPSSVSLRSRVEPPKEEETDDRLSLTLEEIVHIRSVMTKAELEQLPIEVRIKEDVEKRKVSTLSRYVAFEVLGALSMCVAFLCRSASSA